MTDVQAIAILRTISGKSIITDFQTSTDLGDFVIAQATRDAAVQGLQGLGCRVLHNGKYGISFGCRKDQFELAFSTALDQHVKNGIPYYTARAAIIIPGGLQRYVEVVTLPPEPPDFFAGQQPVV